MARAKSAFTYTRYVTYDDEGNASEVTEPFDEDGNLKDDVAPENVNVKPGDDVDISDEDRAGLSGFLHEEEAASEAAQGNPDSDAKSEAKS